MNAYTASACINQPGMFLVFCTTNGWWGKLRILFYGANTTQKWKIYRVDFSMCLRYIHSFKSITFQELRSFLSPNPYISFRFHFMYTPQQRTASEVSFLSIPQAPFLQSVTTQALFHRISSGMFLFSTASKPQWREPSIIWILEFCFQSAS